MPNFHRALLATFAVAVIALILFFTLPPAKRVPYPAEVRPSTVTTEYHHGDCIAEDSCPGVPDDHPQVECDDFEVEGKVICVDGNTGRVMPSWHATFRQVRWHKVTQELADALAEGDAPDATTRNWEACRYLRLPHSHLLIRCPDRYRTRL